MVSRGTGELGFGIPLLREGDSRVAIIGIAMLTNRSVNQGESEC